ncbi:hypothetical protein SKAU_G00343880 [Synaphobranchus kaupii]|uniref:Uncharacterized protein n=1 Tax=Synaphobranchus kaupii TaxID=118154 RepID=A0A9Q1EJ66_SYNKA|nr:hypothetical protein SKAU_G00343880 [Synaphobranchus kaupii]
MWDVRGRLPSKPRCVNKGLFRARPPPRDRAQCGERRTACEPAAKLKCSAVTHTQLREQRIRHTQLSSSCNSAEITQKMLNAALLSVCAVACCQVLPAAARSDGGNFLDDKWLTGRWDKFRDEPGTWNPGKPFDQALDPAKDPCQKVKCSRHKVCVVEAYQTASCVSQRRMR